jgi:hypothetical protein
LTQGYVEGVSDEAIWLQVLQEVGVVLIHHSVAERDILDESFDSGDTTPGILVGEVIGAV